MKYDPSVLKKYAKKIYRKADTVIAFYAIIGAITGFLSSFIYYQSYFMIGLRNNAEIIILIMTISGFLIGALYGKRRSFYLKFQAQMAMCYRQIEINTRCANTNVGNTATNDQIDAKDTTAA